MDKDLAAVAGRGKILAVGTESQAAIGLTMPPSVRMSLPVSASHNRISFSVPPEAIVLPSGLKATAPAACFLSR